MKQLVLILAAVLAATSSRASAAAIPVVIDTDIGAYVDDAFALALAVASPEIEVVGITTVGDSGIKDPFVPPGADRAWLVCRFLTQIGIQSIPVAAGQDPQPKSELDGQIQYRRHPSAIFNRTVKPAKESAVDLLARLARERDGELVVIVIGPCTNIARLLKDQPEAAKKIKRLVVMGGSLEVGYDGKAKAEVEWNIKTDIAAAKAVFASGIPITLVPLDATVMVTMQKPEREKLFSAHTPLTFQVQNLYELWNEETPTLFDPVAIAAAFSERYLTFKDLHIEVDDKGMTLARAGKANVRAATAIKAAEFIDWYVERVRSVGRETLPQPPKNPARLIEPGLFPAHVHAFEDYETDIEKRWWMCGKLETKDVPAPGGRACRAVLTQDFDDRQGDMKTMYRAVIFNPVPGPPMGANTRLKFKYKLAGTDTIRVQLYSLSRGFHRYLSLSRLEQGKWLEGCVDMTQMRCPDGSGGPLASGERIDDIQFYIDPRAELLIDDIILFDAASPVEKRPFPKRIIFTAWFDTGKQGREWPGEFEIVDHEKPRAGKAAKSVPGADGKPVLKVGLRGDRKLDEPTELAFRYRFQGKGELGVELSGTNTPVLRQNFQPAAEEWSDITLKFLPGKGAVANAIRFVLPEQSELIVDDILLYTPGKLSRP